MNINTSPNRDTRMVQQQYNQMASRYDRRWQHYTHQTLQFLLHWADLQPHERVLDLGCGTGELERLHLQEHPQQIIDGIDLAEAMVAIARQKCRPFPQVSFQVGTAEALPYGDRERVQAGGWMAGAGGVTRWVDSFGKIC